MILRMQTERNGKMTRYIAEKHPRAYTRGIFGRVKQEILSWIRFFGSVSDRRFGVQKSCDMLI